MSGGKGTAAEKIAALQEAGVPVATIPSEIPKLIQAASRKSNSRPARKAKPRAGKQVADRKKAATKKKTVATKNAATRKKAVTRKKAAGKKNAATKKNAAGKKRPSRGTSSRSRR